MSLQLQNDPLAKYRKKKTSSIENESTLPLEPESILEVDPLAKYRKKEKKAPEQSQGIEPFNLFGENKKNFGQHLKEVGKQHLQQGSEFQQGLSSGLTLGLSKLIPGPESAEEKEKQRSSKFYKGGEMLGSVFPIDKAYQVFGAPLVNLAKSSPKYTKALESIANITGWGATGAVVKGAEKSIEAIEEGKQEGNILSVSDLVEHGTEWAALDALLQSLGIVGKFAKNLFSKAKSVNKQPWELVNEALTQAKESGVDVSQPDRVAAKALSILEKETPKSSKKIEVKPTEVPAQEKTTQEISKEVFDTESANIAEIKTTAEALKNRKIPVEKFERLEIEPISPIETPKEFNVTEIEDQIANDALNERISGIAQRAESNQQLGRNIQEDLSANFNAAKQNYDAAYALAKEAAGFVQHIPRNTAQVAGEIIQQLNEFKTKPPGYKKLQDDLSNILEDAGFVVSRNEEGVIENIVSNKTVSAEKTMELGKRINELIDYESFDRSVTDRLRIVARAAKSDVRTALKRKKGALEMYRNAETEYGETASKFGRQSVRNIRKMEATEKAANAIKSPTALQDLKVTLSDAQFSQVERELMEHMKNLSEEKANAFYREIRPHISSETQQVAQEILESKLPKQIGRNEKKFQQVKDSIFDEFSKATITGERPKVSLNLWKTKDGQKLVKQVLNDSPNKEEILKYLQDQSFADFASSFINEEGKIDFKKLKELMKDPGTLANIEMMGGQDAVSFFKNIETIAKHAQHNFERTAELIKKMPENQIDKFENFLNGKLTEKQKQIQKRFYENRGRKPTKVEKLAKEKNLTPSKDKSIAKAEKSTGEIGERKIKLMNRKDNPKTFMLEDFIDKYTGKETQSILAAIGIWQFGIHNIPHIAEAYVALNAVKYLAKNKRLRDAVKRTSISHTDPKSFILAIQGLENAMEDSED